MDMTIHEAERRELRGRRFNAIAVLLAIALIASTWMGLFVFLGANTAHQTLQDVRTDWIPDVEAMTLDLPDLGSLSSVYTADGVLLGQLTERNSQPTPLEEIPNLVIGAVLSAEDEDFMDHTGIDYRAVFRALLEDLGGGPRQGGSTITQQVVKANFVGSEPTLERKISEAAIAIELERRFTKEQILEFYLNSVYFGENAYGVKAAAEEYFGKTLRQLTIAEAAALTVPIRNPTLYNLRNDSDIPVRARNAVIDNMVEEGYLAPEDGAAAKADPIVTVVHEEFQDPAPQVLLRTLDLILRDSSNTFGLGATQSQRTRSLFGCPASDTECEGGGGLRIITTVDWDLQEEARRILQEWFPPNSDLPTGAIAMVDNRTGATVVMASGLDFGTDLDAGERQYDLATKGQRNAGSAFKPFGLIAALEQGVPLNSYWDITSPQILDVPGDPRPWECNNADRTEPGIASLERGLYQSINAVFCQLSLAVGAENIVEVAHRLGIESALGAVPSVVLGTQAVTPLEMASAYSTIANYGVRVDNYLIERIEDAEGNVIYRHEVAENQVLEPALAAAVVNTMEKVISGEGATGWRAYLGRPQIGKTGTHEANRDAWFVGAIPQLTTAVWVGYPDAQIEMRNLVIRGNPIRSMNGPRVAEIWHDFMELVVQGLPVEDFPDDPPGTGIYYATPRIEMPDVIGLDFEEAVEEILKAGLEPNIVLVNAEEDEDTVVASDPEPGERVFQGETVDIEISNGLSPTTLLPDLIGSTVEQAVVALTATSNDTQIEFTWVFQEFPTDDPEAAGHIFATDPPVGSEIDEETEVVISVWVLQEG